MNAPDDRKKVYILARKILRINTRIFKQAGSLVEAGYEVKIVGLKTPQLDSFERKDGYDIIRVTPSAFHTRIGRSVAALQEGVSRRMASIRARASVRRIRRPKATTADLPADSAAVSTGQGLRQEPTSTGGRNARRGSILGAFVRPLFGRPLRFALQNLRWVFNSIDYYSKAYGVVMRDPVRPDIVHANDLDTLLVACLLKFRTGAKLVYDAQELYTGMHTLPGWYRILMTVQEFFLVRFADRITVVNDAIAAEMERRYRIRVDAVILNCPPYEESLGEGAGASVREKFGISDTEPIYLYSGGLVKQRGIENTILALRYLPRGVLVILGEGQLRGRLEELLEAEGLTHRVCFAAFVPHTDVPSFISSADVGILPYENVGINHYLCSPSKLFHYIMAELPVACSDFPFLRKVVQGDDLGAVFSPEDPRSIARAVDSILNDGERLSQVKKNLAEAKRRYCWEVEERKFLGVYASLDAPAAEGGPH